MRWLSLVLALSLLAGCAESPPAGPPEPVADFEELELAATATTGVIRGIVVDEAIRPIANATIRLTPGEQEARTGDGGTFGFDGLEPGTYFLRVERRGYNSTQTSAEVVAGVAEPPITKVLLGRDAIATPYVEALAFNGFLSFGAAIFLTSIGTTITSITAEALGDTSIWTVKYTELPMWTQGELVWTHNQAAGGMLIWEMTDTSNTHYGYRETTVSPALAYWDTDTIVEHNETTLDPDRGIAYRFFGGPHPLCTGVGFGCGLTVQQRADAYIHSFYNFAPFEGWRFTVDGDPVVPE